jgi:hypothetical protein
VQFIDQSDQQALLVAPRSISRVTVPRRTHLLGRKRCPLGKERDVYTSSRWWRTAR